MDILPVIVERTNRNPITTATTTEAEGGVEYFRDESGNDGEGRDGPSTDGRWKGRVVAVTSPMLCLAIVALIVAILVIGGLRLEHFRQRRLPLPARTVEVRYNDDGTGTKRTVRFKILQIADIHLGERPDTDWGPEQDRKTYVALEKIIGYERGTTSNDDDDDPDGGGWSTGNIGAGPIDLLLLSGDQLTWNGTASNANATLYYRQLGRFLSGFGIPWAMTFGNHDDGPNTPRDGNITNPHLRRDLYRTDSEFRLSRTKVGPSYLFGTTNYWLDIINDGKDRIDSRSFMLGRILVLDSGGGCLNQEITRGQIEWFQQTNVDHSVPVVAFQHIPTSDFQYSNDEDDGNGGDGNVCSGMNGDGGIAPLYDDAGIVAALWNASNVHFLGVGHNHGNDYCCPLNDWGQQGDQQQQRQRQQYSDREEMSLCFGRHSGYGGYGSWDRGSRVYELTWTTINGNVDSFGWKSWVRLESGEVVDYYGQN